MFRDSFTGQLKFEAFNGLKFWMDYQHNGAPYQASTIRTEDPEIAIVFVPAQHRGNEVFLMRYHGLSIPFSRPHASTLLDGPDYNELIDRNPGFDMVITEIGRPVRWLEYVGREQRFHDIPVDSEFRSRAEQDIMCNLFCDMMGWKAINGTLAMFRGIANKNGDPIQKGRVGFDAPLQKKLDLGVYIRR